MLLKHTQKILFLIIIHIFYKKIKKTSPPFFVPKVILSIVYKLASIAAKRPITIFLNSSPSTLTYIYIYIERERERERVTPDVTYTFF